MLYAEDQATGKLIVRLVTPPVEQATVAIEKRFAEIVREIGQSGLSFERQLGDNLMVARFVKPIAADEMAAAVARLEAHPQITYSEPDMRVRLSYVPIDPRYLTQQWYLYDTYGLHADLAWDSERGDASIIVALLDTGILAHEDLDPGRILAGYDFVGDPAYSNDSDGWDADPTDPGDAVAANECGFGEPASDSSWHGLHLAGLVSATVDNIGIAGINHVAPLLPVRVLGKCGGSFVDVIAAMRWAAGLGVGSVPINPNPARIINLSFGGIGVCTPAVQDAIDQVVAAGAVVVVAAGNNDGLDVSGTLPAGCNNVITVAATDRGGALAAYSNRGSKVLVSAPGGGGFWGIHSIYNTGAAAPGVDTYADLIGTSVATAEVSGVVSLMLAAQPALTMLDVRQILQQTAQPFPAGGCISGGCGAGIVDAAAAVQTALVFPPGSAVSSAPPSNPPAASGSSGGGGGGCVLTQRATDTHDIALAVLLVMLFSMRLRNSWRPARPVYPVN